MPSEGPGAPIWQVISRREARLLFWLVLIALFAIVLGLLRDVFSALAGPAIILFVAWLMSYVLEPPVSWLRRHLPTKGRGIPVAITYVLTGVTEFIVIGAAIVAVVNATIQLVDALRVILPKIGAALAPLFDRLGLSMPSGGSAVTAIQDWFAANASELAEVATTLIRNSIAVVDLITAIFISMGLAVGEVHCWAGCGDSCRPARTGT